MMTMKSCHKIVQTQDSMIPKCQRYFPKNKKEYDYQNIFSNLFKIKNTF